MVDASRWALEINLCEDSKTVIVWHREWFLSIEVWYRVCSLLAALALTLPQSLSLLNEE